jgi:hypothetical protein
MANESGMCNTFRKTKGNNDYQREAIVVVILVIFPTSVGLFPTIGIGCTKKMIEVE